MKATFPKTVTVKGITGISATIYRQKQTKGEAEYVSYTLAYSLLGKLKRETFADPGKAAAAGEEAIRRIASGQQSILELSSRDREQYQRAQEALAPFKVDLDVAAVEYADARTILNGSGTLAEAVRYFLKAHAKELPRITVPAAVEKCLAQSRADGKSEARMKQLAHYLNAFARDMNCEVGEVTPGLVSRYLTAMPASERTKKNCRDVLGYFGRWLVLHGYLERGTDLVEGVQKYSMKSGEIQIFTPAEISKLIEHADNRLLPYIVIGAFAGLRGAEIQRLDWSEIDLADGFIEVTAAKSKTDTRRLVPISANLTTWLRDCRKKSGPVCPIGNVVNALMKLVTTINNAMPENTPDKGRMKWKKNALRHSYISYRVAQCADVARVADESGNSPAIIKANYLRRVKPDTAAEWFGIHPSPKRSKKIVSLAAITSRKTRKAQSLKPGPAVATA
jgi:Phage integrase family